jgi:L-malate glycosyltransferase
VRRINILFVLPVMGMGGSERLVHNLIRKLDRSLFRPSLAWLSNTAPLREFEELEVPLYRLPKSKGADLPAMRKLARIMQAESIDVVNAQHFMPVVYAYYGCKLAAKRSLVFTAHSRWEVEAISRMWRLAGHHLLRRIGATVGVTPDVSSAIRCVFKLEPTHTVTIENGVDTDVFSQSRETRAVRSALGIGDGDIVIGMVANLKQVKNHMFLLQAFAGLGQAYEHVKLVIVGEGFIGEPDNTEPELRLFTNRHGLARRVLFLGRRADVADLLRAMDIFCLTSVREGLPIALIEAMAIGLPVIGTNVEGIREVIAENEDGFLVDPGNVAALRNVLIHLIKDENRRKNLGQVGREKAVKKYSLQRCVREYQHLFLSLIGGAGRL